MSSDVGQAPLVQASQTGLMPNTYSRVQIGPDTVIECPAIIGKPAKGRQDGDDPTVLGVGCHIRPFSTIYAGSIIGDRLETGQGVSIRENNVIGSEVSIGTNTTLEFGNVIGDRSRIHSGCFLEMVELGHDVFIGPNVVFCDDPHPMGCSRYKECRGGAKVDDFARIGANSTILPGVRIGRNALVGAGSVVVEDVPPDSVVVGNPARFLKKISDLKCEAGFYERPYVWMAKEARK